MSKRGCVQSVTESVQSWRAESVPTPFAVRISSFRKKMPAQLTQTSSQVSASAIHTGLVTDPFTGQSTLTPTAMHEAETKG